jgi:metallo-beta-lactamase family protein
MKSISFLGAAGEVTGSSYIVTGADGTKIMVDFGMFQGSDEISALNYKKLSFNSSEIIGVFLTHAHLDHCGRLPLLAFSGFSGKIYMTAPSRALVEVILTDAAKVAKMDMKHAPLYSQEEVDKVLEMIEVVGYDNAFSLENYEVTFRDAGHILGSASLEILDKTDAKRAVFSGDLGNFPEDIVKSTKFIESADYVIMESTYGDSAHPQEDVSQTLQEEINEVEKHGGVLLIPAFSIERTQELLHRINHLKKDGKVSLDTPVFLDSPMGIHATVIFKAFKGFYNEELHTHIDDPFSFEGLVITEDARDSKEIIKAMDPKVIIAGSGMLSGGRMLHHAINYLPLSTTRLLFVGYQSEETNGRKILEGAKSVLINDTTVKVKAHLREIKSMSSHADQPKLLEWLGHIKGVQKVFLIHGDTSQRNTFRQVVKDQLQISEIFLPQNGQEIEL